MIFTSINSLYKNNIVFEANMIIKNREVNQLTPICDGEYAKEVLKEFSALEREQTIEIDITKTPENKRQLVARNVNNGMECKSHPFTNRPGCVFYDFIASLVTRSMNHDEFWKK